MHRVMLSLDEKMTKRTNSKNYTSNSDNDIKIRYTPKPYEPKLARTFRTLAQHWHCKTMLIEIRHCVVLFNVNYQ